MRCARPLRCRISRRGRPPAPRRRRRARARTPSSTSAQCPRPGEVHVGHPDACRGRGPACPGCGPGRRRPRRGSARRWRTRAAWRTARRGRPGPRPPATPGASGAQLVVPRDAPEHVQLGAGAQPDAVEDGQPDGDADALLHADQDHGEQRHRGQPELEEVEAGDGAQIARLEEPQRDEDEDGGQRRQRHVLEDIRPRG